ncbi:MAG: sensor domain-containing diguanylate cyclase, partial [Candidatus Eremiobacterota bacterium]
WWERARVARARGEARVAQRYARAARELARAQGWLPALRRATREFSLRESASQSSAPSGSSGPDVQRLRLERQLAALLDLSLASARVLDPALLAQSVLEHLLSLLGAERACLFWLKSGQVEEVAGRDHQGRRLERLTGYSRSLVEEVARTGRAAVVSAGQDGPVDSSSSVELHGLKSMLAAPLLLREEPVGVLYLDTRLARGLFTEEDVALLAALGSHIAVSLETARAAEMELLYKTESQQRELAETVRDLATSLAHTLEVQEVWERLFSVISERLRGVGAALEGGTWRLLEGTLPEPLPQPDPEGGSQQLGEYLLLPLGGALPWLAIWRDESLDETEGDLAHAFAGQASLALEKARLFSEVLRLATTDGLTGLFNRRHFFQVAERELGLAHRHNEPLSAVLLDVDHFKSFNDTHGHDVGDEVLKTVAGTLAATLRREDLLARYGGEEFVVLLPRTAGPEALSVACERLRLAVQGNRVQGRLQVTISLGVAQLRPGESLNDLLIRADKALYRSKHAGRNCATLAD